MHIQTICEQRFWAKVIRASYPDENWSLSTLQMVCHLVSETCSAVTHCADRGRLRSVAAAGEHLNTLNLNTEWAADIYHWKVWTADDKLCEVWFVIREYSTYKCMFTWKVNFFNLICCVRWTISIASMKFAGYVVWILTYCEYSHIKSESFTQIHTTIAELQKFF